MTDVQDDAVDYRVVTATNREVFKGPEKDARLYLERNFPRPHNEFGVLSYGAHLVDPSGIKEQYHVEEGWSDVNDA